MQTKAYNQRIILETVRLRGPISRAEIVRLTTLSPQTVYNLMNELVDQQLVVAQRQRRGQAGQPPTELAINPDGALALGLHLDRDHIFGILLDLTGSVRDTVRYEETFRTPEEALPLLHRVAQQLIPNGTLRERLWGVGVALPGPTAENPTQSFNPSDFEGWRKRQIEDYLGQHLALPILVENDARAAALGEHWRGAGRTLQSFFYIYFGLGLGGSLIIDGEPYTGFMGSAGGIGHVPIAAEGRRCYCGGIDCLESYVSLNSLYTSLAQQGVNATNPQALEQLFHDQNTHLLTWLEIAANHLAQVIIAVENLLDPQAVLFGGRLPTSLLDYLLAHVEDPWSGRRMRDKTHKPSLQRSFLSGDAAALGAAVLPIFDVLAPSPSYLLKPLGEQPAEPLLSPSIIKGGDGTTNRQRLKL